MRVGAIKISEGSIVGTYCTIMPDSVLDGRLMDLSAGSGEMSGMWDGVPAVRIGAALGDDMADGPSPLRWWVWSTSLLALGVLNKLISYAPVLVLSIWLWPTSWDLAYFVAYLVAVLFVGGVASIITRSIMLRLHGPVPQGVYRRYSAQHLRIESKLRLSDFSNEAFGGTLWMSVMMRCYGFRVHTWSIEWDATFETLPDALSIAQGAFGTGGIYCSPFTFTARDLHVQHTRIGKETFIGNAAVVTPGQLRSHLLVGVQTRSGVGEAAMVPGATDAPRTHFGRPVMVLPKRGAYGVEENQPPRLHEFLYRVVFEAGIFLLPLPRVLILFVLLRLLYAPGYGAELPLEVAAAAACAVGEVAFIAFLVVQKWVLLRRVRPGLTRSLWAPFVRHWHYSYEALLQYMQACAVMPGWAGFNVLARSLGARVGERVTGANFLCCVDPDMWSVGDDVALNHFHPQLHTFEDSVLKIGAMDIGAGATMLPCSMVMQGGVVGAGAVVGAMGCVMKSQGLEPGGRYEGVPCELVGDAPEWRKLPAAMPPAAAAAPLPHGEP